MSKTGLAFTPPDQEQRQRALDPTRSILVQAPAGSGKTDLLTRRFLRLLSQVDEPGRIVAITFTIAAAAEMRHRILAELERAAAREDAETASAPVDDEFSMECLAHRALLHSNARGWKLLDLPAQLRISTIDAFCRELALQQPLLSGLGDGLAIAEEPKELYRRAAHATLAEVGNMRNLEVSAVVEALLLWRDNNWQEMEAELVNMLERRDRWMQQFVLSRNPDWDALRKRLERPFANAVRDDLTHVSRLLDQAPGAREEALELAQFACSHSGGEQHRELAELVEFPCGPFLTQDALDEAHGALVCLANLLLTNNGGFRKVVDKRLGFPADRKAEKARIAKLIADLNGVPGLESALAEVRNLPPTRYDEDDWQIVKACFTLLRHAAAQLKVAFAEAAKVDFVEVAQIAESVLKSEDGRPTDAAIAVADGIRHLLVDEFQDTSRRQHQLLAGLIAAWPDSGSDTGVVGDQRTLFAVGDPMQSIYFFRDADAELFARVKEIGLEIPNAEPLRLDFVPLSANFRTAPALVRRLNEVFTQVFKKDDGSGIEFSTAEPARREQSGPPQNFELHLNFIQQTTVKQISNSGDMPDKGDPQSEQVSEIVEIIRSRRQAMEKARATGGKYRIAVLARAKRSLAPIAEALREAGIPFRAVELERLADRPEILDALALARALLNPYDRIAWLGVLRAPWCGLTLEDLHRLTSADESALLARPVPDLLAERLERLSPAGQSTVRRLVSTLASHSMLRAGHAVTSPGTWLQQVWLSLGGADCCDATARANLELLWNCLDSLPEGEQDLLGPALDAALDRLTALPNPNASGDCGVQLMTIHKSKGLEFEVVIVPDLQATTRATSRKLLSWLERGLTPDSEGSIEAEAYCGEGEITEFLIAPLQFKGADSGRSKAWVDRVYRVRESQETRRILYVAATRAREELHLFARPSYKVEASGEFTLAEPANSLLATAWPALEAEVRSRFEEWKASELGAEIEMLAASAENNLLVMPSAAIPAKPTLLRRLPEGYRPTLQGLVGADSEGSISGLGDSRLYARHEGGLVSRALGTAVHALFEELARLRATGDWPFVRTALSHFVPRMAAQIRASGVDQNQAAKLAAEALQLALAASNDPIAQWILSPHTEAASEACWAGVVDGGLRTVRVDRVFRAGLWPLTDGQDAWWIIDYKTAHADVDDPAAALPELRKLFAPQIEAYARVLRNLHGVDAILRAGLYYPRMLLLDWWVI
jgi:ATP-dependent exoDNAse (exonuclease V) beta subunit